MTNVVWGFRKEESLDGSFICECLISEKWVKLNNLNCINYLCTSCNCLLDQNFDLSQVVYHARRWAHLSTCLHTPKLEIDSKDCHAIVAGLAYNYCFPSHFEFGLISFWVLFGLLFLRWACWDHLILAALMKLVFYRGKSKFLLNLIFVVAKAINRGGWYSVLFRWEMEDVEMWEFLMGLRLMACMIRRLLSNPLPRVTQSPVLPHTIILDSPHTTLLSTQQAACCRSSSIFPVHSQILRSRRSLKLASMHTQRRQGKCMLHHSHDTISEG
jgi:hypothetical protein